MQELYDGGFTLEEINAADEDGALFDVPDTFGAQMSALSASLVPAPSSRSMIAGIVVGAVAFVCIIIACIIVYKRRNNKDAGRGGRAARRRRGGNDDAHHVPNPAYDVDQVDAMQPYGGVQHAAVVHVDEECAYQNDAYENVTKSRLTRDQANAVGGGADVGVYVNVPKSTQT